jgi:hypothetical protein
MTGVGPEVPEAELERLRRPDVMASIDRSRADFAQAAKQRDSASGLRRDLAFLKRKFQRVDNTNWPGYSEFLSRTIHWERVHQSRNLTTQTTIWVAP